MPISSNYVVQYLLQTTQAHEGQTIWREKESGGYATSISGIELELDNVPSRSGSRLHLSLFCVSERVYIAEPLSIGLLKEKYESEDQRQLARLMKELAAMVARQCSSDRSRRAAMADVIQQMVFSRLIGAAEGEG